MVYSTICHRKKDCQLLEEITVPSERRRSQAENRAAKRFLAMMLEKYPAIARLGYPVSGDENTVYIKVVVNPKDEHEIFEFAAALTGLIAEQEGIKVLLMREEENNPELGNDDQLKSLQQTISNHVGVLRKLRQFRDAEAKQQRAQYLTRLRSNFERIIDYLCAQSK